MQTKQLPAIDWFTWPSDEPRLIGSRCASCGDHFFPRVSVCRNPACRGKEVSEAPLSRRGRLWSYLIQDYPPPPPYPAPKPFVPFGIAEVKLPEGIRVLGQVARDTPLDSLQIGMEMELVIEGLGSDEQGNELLVWKFRPVS